MTERLQSFKELQVWRKSHQLFLDTVKDVEQFPHTRAAVIIADQLLRSTGSISANIAEGYGRHAGAEFVHFLIVARGSTTESQNWFSKCKDLAYISADQCSARESTCSELVKMLNSIIGSVRRKMREKALEREQ